MVNPYEPPTAPIAAVKARPRGDLRAIFAQLLVTRFARFGVVVALAGIVGGVGLARDGHAGDLGYPTFYGSIVTALFIGLGIAIGRASQRPELLRWSRGWLLGALVVGAWGVILLRHP